MIDHGRERRISFWTLYCPASDQYFFSYHTYGPVPEIKYTNSAGNACQFITESSALAEKNRLLEIVSGDVKLHVELLVPRNMMEVIRVSYQVVE